MHESHLPVLARTMRGIESIARDEVRSRLGVEAHIGHRELCFSAPLTPALLQLGTVDDLFVVLGELEGVTRRREALARVAGFRADLDAVARLLGRPGGRSFDVTASFLGRRNYNRFELEDALVPDAAWTRVARDGRLSLRIHAAEGLATVAVRIASRPLHRRAYRVATVPGSLHPRSRGRSRCSLAACSSIPSAARARSRSRERSPGSRAGARTATWPPSRRRGETRAQPASRSRSRCVTLRASARSSAW